jgi:hypothetical protein
VSASHTSPSEVSRELLKGITNTQRGSTIMTTTTNPYPDVPLPPGAVEFPESWAAATAATPTARPKTRSTAPHRDDRAQHKRKARHCSGGGPSHCSANKRLVGAPGAGDKRRARCAYAPETNWPTPRTTARRN